MGFFDKIKHGLADRINSVLASMGKVDEDLFQELEEALIVSDVGMETTDEIISKLRSEVKTQKLSKTEDVKAVLKKIMVEMLEDDSTLNLDTSPSIIIIVGVNGVGKTTTIGKLSDLLKKRGKNVLLAAADTFRAAAIDQLDIWAGRAGVEMIKPKEGADPSSVVFDAIQALKARKMDVLICDTAGRLHTKRNLMDELGKISRVIDRELPGAPRETLLVIDATTGQNGIAQAKAFNEFAGLTGIILTKLDGTAKGGIIISIKKLLGVPVKFVGTGEKIDDLSRFDAGAFISEIFG